MDDRLATRLGGGGPGAVSPTENSPRGTCMQKVSTVAIGIVAVLLLGGGQTISGRSWGRVVFVASPATAEPAAEDQLLLANINAGRQTSARPRSSLNARLKVLYVHVGKTGSTVPQGLRTSLTIHPGIDVYTFHVNTVVVNNLPRAGPLLGPGSASPTLELSESQSKAADQPGMFCIWDPGRTCVWKGCFKRLAAVSKSSDSFAKHQPSPSHTVTIGGGGGSGSGSISAVSVQGMPQADQIPSPCVCNMGCDDMVVPPLNKMDLAVLWVRDPIRRFISAWTAMRSPENLQKITNMFTREADDDSDSKKLQLKLGPADLDLDTLVQAAVRTGDTWPVGGNPNAPIHLRNGNFHLGHGLVWHANHSCNTTFAAMASQPRLGLFVGITEETARDYHRLQARLGATEPSDFWELSNTTTLRHHYKHAGKRLSLASVRYLRQLFREEYACLGVIARMGQVSSEWLAAISADTDFNY